MTSIKQLDSPNNSSIIIRENFTIEEKMVQEKKIEFYKLKNKLNNIVALNSDLKTRIISEQTNEFFPVQVKKGFELKRFVLYRASDNFNPDYSDNVSCGGNDRICFAVNIYFW